MSAQAALRSEIEQQQATIAEQARTIESLERAIQLLSHDLQAPLRSVMGFSELLADHNADRLDPQSTEYLGYLSAGAARMRDYLRDLTRYSRVLTCQLSLSSQDMGQLVEQAVTRLEANLSPTDEVSWSGLPTLRVDKNLMTDVFEQLLSNAKQFSGPAAAKVRIAADEDEAFWHFSVHDVGQGFDASLSEQVFELFRKLQPKAATLRTGAGLAISSKIIEKHGGRMWAESSPGNGATFHFTLPGAPAT